MVGGAKGKPGAGGARWRPRPQLWRCPMEKPTEGGAMVEEWPPTPWDLPTAVEQVVVEPEEVTESRRARVLLSAILKTFYSGAIESVLTQCISVWYITATNQDCKALQRVVRLAERISGSALPSLQDIYLKRCKSRAVKIIKD